MKKEIDHWSLIFQNLTKEEAAFIEEILNWDDEKKAAFMFAKRVFDEEIDELDQLQK